jgi:hypothetical protein
MADQIRATPRNPFFGLFSDLVNAPLSYMSDPRRTQQMQGVASFLRSTGVPYTLENLSYDPSGRGLFTGAGGLGGTTRLRPEVAEAALTVAPFVGPAAQLGVRGAMATGRTLGPTAARMAEGYLQRQRLMLGVVPDEYRGSHTAPGPDFGAPLHDLTGGGQMYPADVYSSKAAQYYGGGVPYDQKAFSIAQQFKDKPDAFVTIYRAVPKEMSNSEKLEKIEKEMAAYMRRGTLPQDAENYSSGSKWYDAAYDMRETLRKMPDEPTNEISKINPGDWVTLTREYAKEHGESALRGKYKILSQKVRAKDVWTNADSIHEFGYQPQSQASKFQAPQQAAPGPLANPMFADPFANTIDDTTR